MNDQQGQQSQQSQHWVFGYGSLMWRPGFEYLQRQTAELTGFHRSLCVYSHVHRGTESKPGLVFGLDHGGSCTGIAYQVAAENWSQTFDYLQEREQVTAVYHDHFQEINLIGDTNGDNQKVTALTFLVDRDHKQYAGVLNIAEQLEFINQGEGQSGHCRDYVIATAAHLVELDVQDDDIQMLARTLSQD